MQSISERIQAAKDAVTIPELWNILRLPGEMPRGGTGGGLEAMKRWAGQLPCPEVPAFSFEGLTRRDGKPVKDLNDDAVISEADRSALEELLP